MTSNSIHDLSLQQQKNRRLIINNINDANTSFKSF